jgi:hypothetical protein
VCCRAISEALWLPQDLRANCDEMRVRARTDNAVEGICQGRVYVCTTVASGSCAGPQGDARDLQDQDAVWMSLSDNLVSC